MKISCIAIDDEPLALDIIKDYCLKVPFLDLVRTFDSGLDSLEYIRSNKIDLIFLDIQMQDLTGIQLLKTLKNKPYVIFTTAYDAYAIQGFELDVIDYMLKPISFERFLKGVDKVYEKMQLDMAAHTRPAQTTNATQAEEFFFVKTESRMEKIRYSDVLYIEGMGDYWRIVTHAKRIMTLVNYKKLEELLPPKQFIRVHKSFIVAIEKIESVERNRIKIADRLIPVSETYRKMFFDILENKKCN